MKSWRDMLHEELIKHNDKLIANTLTTEQMDIKFMDGFGSYAEVISFTAWSETRVYFPAVYDGSYWVDSVPRNPCNERVIAVGGG